MSFPKMTAETDTQVARPSQRHIEEALCTVGIACADTVLVHADLTKFGFFKDKKGRFCLVLEPQRFLNALKTVIGPAGTIAVPTFSYTWSKKEIFRVYHSPSLMGSFSELVRQYPSSIRNHHPLLSVAALGEKAGAICANTDRSGFGSGSPYRRLHELNAKLLMVGVPFCSFKDYVEVECKVPYRYKKYFHGAIEDRNGVFEAVFEHDVRYTGRNAEPMPFYEGLSREERKAVRSAELGNSTFHCIDSKSAYNLLRTKLEADPFSFLKRPPSDAYSMLLVSKILGRSGQSSGGLSLQTFAIEEEGVEKWVWSISGTGLLGERVLTHMQQKSRIGSSRWWLDFVDENAEYALCIGDKNESGADRALQIANKLMKEKRTGTIADFRKEFLSDLVEGDISGYILSRQ